MGELPPFVGVAVKVTGVPAQILFSDASILIEGAAGVVTTIVMLLLAAGTVQAALLVSVQLTISLLTSAASVNVALFVPALVPLTIHWYVGALPPFAATAVNVTSVPLQILFADDEIEITGVSEVVIIPFTVTFWSAMPAEESLILAEATPAGNETADLT